MKTYIREFAHTVIFAITILLVACIFAIPAIHFWVMDIPTIPLAIAYSFLALFSIFFAIVAIKSAIQQNKANGQEHGMFPYTQHYEQIDRQGLGTYTNEALAYLQKVEHRWWAYKNTAEKLTEEEQQVVFEHFSESMKTFANARGALEATTEMFRMKLSKDRLSHAFTMLFHKRAKG